MGLCAQRGRRGVSAAMLACLSVVWLCSWLTTAAAGGPLLTINQIQAQQLPDVAAYLTVSDESGIPITGLSAADFEVFEDGDSLTGFTVTAVDQSQESIAAILAIDTSGSMKGQPLEDAKAAAKSFIADLAASDQVAVLSFGEQVTLLQGFTTERDALQASIESLAAEGNTTLYDAVYDSVGFAAHLPPGRKMVLVLTDGEDTESSVTLDDAIERAEESNVPVFAVALGQVIADPLKRLTKLTGGRYYEALSSDELTERFKLVASQLREQYVLHYRSQVVADGSEYSLVVKVTHQGQASQDSRSFVALPVKPTVSLPGLTDGMQVRGLVEVVPEILPADYVTRAEYTVDGALVATVDRAPFSFRWSTAGAEPGDHVLAVQVLDTAGNTAEAARTLRVMSPLSVRITHPVDGKVVQGKVRLTVALAPDGVAERVEYLLDGEPLAIATAAPFAYEWDTATVPAGQHSLTARASGQGESAEHQLQIVVEGGGLPLGLIVGLAVLAIAAVPFVLMMRRRGPVEAPAMGQTRQMAVPGDVAALAGAWLEDPEGQRWPLRAEGTLVGRQVGPGDIRIDDPLASRQHGEVRLEDGEYVFYDLGATNPALINGASYAGPHRLREGDVLTIGDTSLVFGLSD